MRRKQVGLFLIILYLSLLSTTASAELTSYSRPTEWGYINDQGELVIPIQYERAGDFSDGLAWIWQDGKYGFINKQGEIAIPVQFTSVLSFSEGLAAVQVDKRWGYINQSGTFVIQPRFDSALSFIEGRARVKMSDYWGYIGHDGEYVFPPVAKQAYDFSDGLARINYKYRDQFINLDGEIVIEEIKAYGNFASYYSDGLLLIEEDYNYGFIDHKGEIAIPINRDHYSYDFSEGYALTFDRPLGKWGYLNTQGEFAIPPQFTSASDFSEGKASVFQNDQLLIINQQGETLFNLPYQDVGPFSGGLAAFYSKQGNGFIDQQGQVVYGPTLLKVKDFSDGMARVGWGGLGYKDEAGKMVIPPVLDRTGSFSNGRALVQLDDYYGYLSSTGEWIVPPIYVVISKLNDDLFIAAPERNWQAEEVVYLNRAGEIVKTFADHLNAHAQKKNHLLQGTRSVLHPRGLSFRAQPGLSGQRIGAIPYGDQVKVLEVTDQTFTSEGIQGHWALVEYKGQQGYVFDGYLTNLPAPDLSRPYFDTYISDLMGEYERDKIWYTDDESMSIDTSQESGVIRVHAGVDETDAATTYYYLAGTSKRELFLLLKLFSGDLPVYRLNEQSPVLKYGALKFADVDYPGDDGDICIELYGEEGDSFVIIEEKEAGFFKVTPW